MTLGWYIRGWLKMGVDSFYNEMMSHSLNMRGNLPYQIVMARCHYMRDRHSIPDLGPEMAKYYKRVWNTWKGKATAEKAWEAYRK